MEQDPFTGRVIGCAIEVHRVLGPGLLESTYQQCLAHELSLSSIPFKLEHPMPVLYKGVRLDCGYRIDVQVDDRLILELSSSRRGQRYSQGPIADIHEAVRDQDRPADQL